MWAVLAALKLSHFPRICHYISSSGPNYQGALRYDGQGAKEYEVFWWILVDFYGYDKGNLGALCFKPSLCIDGEIFLDITYPHSFAEESS